MSTTKLYNKDGKRLIVAEENISVGDTDDVDFAISDTYGNSVFKIVDGHIQTRKFDSSNIKASSSSSSSSSSTSESSWLDGKNVVILGDSISTNGNGLSKTYHNAYEIIVTSEDVGVELSAYVTYYDVSAGLTLGGHTFTSSEIGTEVTFTPTSDDVGKGIGCPNDYNGGKGNIPWWIETAETLGFTPIPVCWSGSSITSHEKGTSTRKCSWSWHESQLRKMGIRTAGSMNRTAPDAIIIYRGTNDLTHTPYAQLTKDYFDNINLEYPTDDYIEGDSSYFGYIEGMVFLISKIRSLYPNAPIFLCTLNVFKRINWEHFPTNNGIDTLPQYNNAIRAIADYMGCGLIEFDKDGITFENCYSLGYVTDAGDTFVSASTAGPTHPTTKGHKLMAARAISDLLNQKYKI